MLGIFEGLIWILLNRLTTRAENLSFAATVGRCCKSLQYQLILFARGRAVHFEKLADFLNRIRTRIRTSDMYPDKDMDTDMGADVDMNLDRLCSTIVTGTEIIENQIKRC